MPIKDYSQTDVVTIGPRALIIDAAQQMVENHVGCLVVVEDEKPIGMLTDRDIVRRVIVPGKDPRHTPASEAMTPHPVTVNQDVGVFDAISTMSDEGVRRLPLVDESGRLVGLVAFDDLLLLLGSELVNLAGISPTERYRERYQARASQP